MPESEPPTSSVRGLRAVLLRPHRGQAIIAILLCVLGFAAVTQVRTTTDNTNYSAYRTQDLVDLLTALSATSSRVQTQISQLQATKADLERNTDDRRTALAQATKQVADLRILAGLVPAVGPGITVSVSDPAATVTVGSMLDLIEELRTAGAEAISVNSVRVVASTAFDAGDGGLVIGGQQLRAPYTVTAIGEPATLAGAVTFTRGPQFELEGDGATVTVAQGTRVEVRPIVTR